MVRLFQSCTVSKTKRKGKITTINTGKRLDREEKKPKLRLCPYNVADDGMWALKTIPF